MIYDDKRFKILKPKWNDPDETVPWEIVARHTKQAEANHYQSLERLNERGGLSWRELYYILRDEQFPFRDAIKTDEARQECLKIIAAAGLA